MERPATATTRRPQGVVAKLLAQQPHGTASVRRGNQKFEEEDDDDSDRSANPDDDREAPERCDDNDPQDEAMERKAIAGNSLVETFSRALSVSPSSSSSVGAPSSIATPPSSPDSQKQLVPEEEDDDWNASSSSSDGASSVASARSSETVDPEPARHDTADAQLQSDMEVLVAHLQQQALTLEHERAVRESLQSEWRTTQQTLTREIDGIRIENDALRHQNAVLVAERDASVQQAQTLSEAHDEVLRALQAQQQRDSNARTIIAALVKERDALTRQLDESKTYCRRLEEEVVTLRAEQQHLRAETTTLQTAVAAATSHRNDRELRVIHEQEQLITSLRADVLQMEFEYRTLRVDKDKLHHRVATLQRQSEAPPSTSYDVISLRGDGDKTTNKPAKLKRLSLSTASAAKGGTTGGGGGEMSFTNLMTLPNCVDDTGVPVVTTVARPRTPVGSLVAKTLSSAKKKLFQLQAPATTVVLPQ